MLLDAVGYDGIRPERLGVPRVEGRVFGLELLSTLRSSYLREDGEWPLRKGVYSDTFLCTGAIFCNRSFS
jgi:hypothetical protein